MQTAVCSLTGSTFLTFLYTTCKAVLPLVVQFDAVGVTEKSENQSEGT